MMRIRLMLADGQHRVEQQHALIRPRLEAAVVRHLAAEVRFQFLEDVEQGWRRLHAGQYGEREAMRLSRAMIRVLSEDDHLRVCIARIVKGVEDRVHVRIHVVRPVLLNQELPELAIIRFLELRIEELRPIIVKDFHRLTTSFYSPASCRLLHIAQIPSLPGRLYPPARNHRVAGRNSRPDTPP